MGQKKISAEQIRSAKASLDTINTYIGSNTFTLDDSSWVSDSSRDLIVSGGKIVTSTTDKIIQSVESLDAFLKQMADTFEKADIDLAQHINSSSKMKSLSSNPYESSVR